MKKILTVLLLAIFIASGVALSSCASSEQILIYCTSEEERIAYLQEKLHEKFPDYNIIIQYSGTGQLVSKLQSEGNSTDCDIIYELEANNMELLLSKNSDLFADLSSYSIDKFEDSSVEYTENHQKYLPTVKTYGAITINKKVLESKGLAAPTTYADLIDPKYKDLISMPNPKSSGTGYLFYNGLVSTMGEEATLSYFESLTSNVKEYTSSGSAPIKALDRGDVAIGMTMLFQAYNYCKNLNSDLEYTFLDYGAPSNLYTMTMIKNHETRPAVLEVFNYIYEDLNQEHIEALSMDKLYKNQKNNDTNYPMNIQEMKMNGLFDSTYKQDLLDKWKF